MFWLISLTILSSFLGASLGSLLCPLFFKDQILDKPDTRSIIPKNRSKRAPRILTDEMAYLKEIQEQGENRG